MEGSVVTHTVSWPVRNGRLWRWHKTGRGVWGVRKRGKGTKVWKIRMVQKGVDCCIILCREWRRGIGVLG